MACLQLVCDDQSLCKSAAAPMASAFKSAGCSLPIHLSSSASELPPQSAALLCIIIVDPISRASVAALHQALANFSPADISRRVCVLCTNARSFHLHSFPLSSLVALFASQSLPYCLSASDAAEDLKHAFSCIASQFLPTIAPHQSPSSQVPPSMLLRSHARFASSDLLTRPSSQRCFQPFSPKPPPTERGPLSHQLQAVGLHCGRISLGALPGMPLQPQF
jgi:hypothetical protein